MAEDTFKTKAGEEVTVTVPSGGGTGYSWKVLGGLPSQASVTHEFVPPSGGAIGAPGQQILKFRFDSTGTHEVDLGFVSPSGQDIDKVRKLHFDVE